MELEKCYSHYSNNKRGLKKKNLLLIFLNSITEIIGQNTETFEREPPTKKEKGPNKVWLNAGKNIQQENVENY